MKPLSVFLLFITFYGCSKKQADLPRIIVPERDTIITINAKEMLQSFSPKLAVDFVCDTSVFKLSEIKYFSNLKEGQYPEKWWTLKTKVKIEVDTSHAFYSGGFIYRTIPYISPGDSLKVSAKERTDKEWWYKIYTRRQDSIMQKQIKSFPVLIKNLSTTSLYFNNGPTFIQEALDSYGKWKPIEFVYSFPGCGMGREYAHYAVRPNHYIALGIIKYTGDFKTKLRVKVMIGSDVFYSNEFSGSINKSQFSITPAEKMLFQYDDKLHQMYYYAEMGYMFLNNVDWENLEKRYSKSKYYKDLNGWKQLEQ